MSGGIRLDIEPPVDGWTTLQVTAPGIALKFIASYVPRDSIGDLAKAAAGLVDGVLPQVVTWNTEPVEYDFRFLSDEHQTRLEIWKFPDYRRQLGHVGELAVGISADAVAFARTLWRGLRRLQGAVSADEYLARWGHPFPAAAVARLGEELQRQITLDG